MNFSDIYKKIRSIDERASGDDELTPPGINRLTGKPIAPRNTGPSWDEMSPEQQQAFVAKQKADRAAAAAAAQTPNSLQNNVTPGGAYTRGLEEDCGDMMPQSPAQQDNVDMNVTLHGSGPGGIRDLMSILRDIEGKDSNGGMAVAPHADDLEIMVGDMEEEYGNSAPDSSGTQTASIQDVTNVGTTTNGGDHTRNRQAGLPQANAHSMHEAVKSRLQQQYDAIKQEGQLDELGGGLLRSYVKKAVGDITDRSKDVGQGLGFQKGAQFATKAFTGADIAASTARKDPKIDQRKAGIDRAVNKISGDVKPELARESTDLARVKQLNTILNG
jgi:hypothetical protein